MTALAFSKLIPGGNPTILLHDPDIRPDELAGVSAKLMSALHLHAEQVGALYSGKADEWSSSSPDWDLPRLAMMGGEFCVNAVRSSALCLARQGWLLPRDVPGASGAVWGGRLTVSGAEVPVRVLVSPDADALALAVGCNGAAVGSASRLGKKALPELSRLFCAAEVSCPLPEEACATLREGVSLVSLPGISHLLVDAGRHPLPEFYGEIWKQESASWRASYGIADLPASGVIWYERDDAGYSIWPAVAVKATGSEHLESACGSASLAVALLHAVTATRHGAADDPVSVAVRQPSGERLDVTCAGTKARTKDGTAASGAAASGSAAPAVAAPGLKAWVSGPVLLAAEGKTYV